MDRIKEKELLQKIYDYEVKIFRDKYGEDPEWPTLGVSGLYYVSATGEIKDPVYDDYPIEVHPEGSLTRAKKALIDLEIQLQEDERRQKLHQALVRLIRKYDPSEQDIKDFFGITLDGEVTYFNRDEDYY